MGKQDLAPGIARINNWMRDALGVTDEFIEKLESDDDWTFIIKLHAIVEAGLNRALLLQLENPPSKELEELVSKLDTSNFRSGKVAFAKAFKMISPKSCEFIQKLSETRNACVHDVKNFSFDFKAHLNAMKEGDSKAFLKVMAAELKSGLRGSQEVDAHAVVLHNPRFGLYAATMHVMFQLLSHLIRRELYHARLKLAARKAELFDERNQPKTKES